MWKDFHDEAKACETVSFVLDAINSNNILVDCNISEISFSFHLNWVVGSDFIAIFVQEC